MRKPLILLICLAQLPSAAFVAQAFADDKRPGGLPGDWRTLGDGKTPEQSPPRPFDFGLDGLVQSPRLAPGLGQKRLEQGERKTAPGAPSGASNSANDASAAQAAKARVRAENLKKAMAPRPDPAALRQRALDELFKQLRAATDPREARDVAQAVERVWLQSQSDTANLLMQRALLSIRSQDYPVALSLLDKILDLEPGWAEAWNQRATIRFLTDDPDGSMADIDQVIKLEPRHFGALAGMGMILQRAGFDKRALEVFNKSLEIYPEQPDVKETV